jgi:titin
VLGQFQGNQPYNEAFLTAFDFALPLQPTGLAATLANPTSIQLSWTDNNSDEEGFRVQRWDSASAVYSDVATPPVNSTTYSDTGLTPGLRYIYQVLAFNAGSDSRVSNKAQVTLPPASPQPLNAILETRFRALLTWANVAGETSYRLERSVDSGVFTLRANLGANVTLFRDPGLLAGKQYTYRLSAINAGGTSTSVTTSINTPPDPPTAPTGLAAGTVTATSVGLSWTDTSNSETEFRIYRWDQTSGVYAVIQTTAANVTSYVDTSVVTSTRYVYYVTASNGTGSSSGSNKVSVTTPAS